MARPIRCRLTVALLLIALLFSSGSGAQVTPAANATPQEGFTFSLTPEESAWLAEHPTIRVGMMEAWPPLDFVDQRGRPQGIGVDYIALVNKRLVGILTLVPAPFEENYNRVASGDLDCVLDITPKKEREAHFNFTKPYIVIPHVIVGRVDGPYFASETDLAGKTLALERGFHNVIYVTNEHPLV